MTPHPPIHFPGAWALQTHAAQRSHKALAFVQQRPLLGCVGSSSAAYIPTLPHSLENLSWPYGASLGLCAPGSACATSLPVERIACFGVALDSFLQGSKIRFFSGAGNFETPLNMYFQGQGHKPCCCKFRPNKKYISFFFWFCFGKCLPPDLRNYCFFLHMMLSLIYLTNSNIQKLHLLIQDNLGFLLAKLK